MFFFRFIIVFLVVSLASLKQKRKKKFPNFVEFSFFGFILSSYRQVFLLWFFLFFLSISLASSSVLSWPNEKKTFLPISLNCPLWVFLFLLWVFPVPPDLSSFIFLAFLWQNPYKERKKKRLPPNLVRFFFSAFSCSSF